MVKFRPLWAFTLILFIKLGETFTKNETEIIVSLAEYFRTSFCIFIENKKPSGLELDVKKINLSMNKKILIGSLRFKQVSKLLAERSQSKHGGRPMIVTKLGNKTIESIEKLSRTSSISSVIWLIFSKESLEAKNFRNAYIPFDCEFLFVNQNETAASLTELYQIEKDSPVYTFNFGYWTHEDGLYIANKNFYKRRGSLKGHTLKGIIQNNPPYVFIHNDSSGMPQFSGYLYEVWSELEFRINFRTEFPTKFFNKDPEQILDKGDVDFAVARIPNELSLFQYMDFSQPVDEAKFYMFGHRPGSELDWDSYLKPFSPNTWFVNLVWMLFSSFALAILYKIAWDFGTSEREAKYFIFTFSESLLTVFRAICMQGSDVTPRSNSCRLLFLSIYLTALVVTSAFSAALFSLLTIPKPRSPFNNLDEVLMNRRYKLGLPADPNLHRLIEDFSNTLPFTWQFKLFEKLTESKEKMPLTPQEGLEKLCQDKMYVLMYDLPNVLYLMQNMTRSCQDRILPSGPPLFTEYIGFGFKKNSPYKKLIDFHLIRMKNEGILNRLLVNYWPPQIPTVQATWVRVTLADISPILYMFGLGAVFGAALLYVEKILLHFKARKYRFRNSALSNRLLINHELVKSNITKNKVLDHWDMFINKRINQNISILD